MTLPPAGPGIPRITSESEIIHGFSLQFLSKWEELIVNRYAEPILIFEKNLLDVKATEIGDFVNQLSGELLGNCYTAIGASDKSKQHLPKDENTIRGYVSDALDISGANTIDSVIKILIIGFSLVSGDSMGGASRNLVGNRGEDKIQAILSSNFDGTIMQKNTSGRPKITQFKHNASTYFVHWNKRIPKAKKNYDFIVTRSQSFHEDDVVAVLEIKSGCDPAGADEHWNTAKGKLNTLKSAEEGIRCGFASIIIDSTVRNHIAQEINSGLINCGINLNDDLEIINGIISLL